MTDKLTIDERVKLAEFCGHEVSVHGDEVWFRGEDRGHLWNPAEDANQRDEVVEAVRQAGWWVSVRSLLPHYVAYAQRHKMLKDGFGNPYYESMPNIEADTPGDAVTQAALKVIGDKNAD